jgi:hypothetical protein
MLLSQSRPLNFTLDSVRLGEMEFCVHAYFSQSANPAAATSLGATSGSMPTGNGHSMPTAESFHKSALSVSGR